MATHFWVAIVNGVRRCPTLPQGPPCSTIGAESLSFRVRNVTGRFPLAMAAETLLIYQSFRGQHAPHDAPSPAGSASCEGSPWGGNNRVKGCSRFPTVDQEPHSGRKHNSFTSDRGKPWCGVVVLSIYRLISTGQLHGSLVPTSTSSLSTQ